MELVRYRPGEAIRWLQTGAEDTFKSAKRKGRSVVRREGERTITKDFKDVAGAMMEFGKSAWAQLKHRQAEATEFVLLDDHFEARNGDRTRIYAYADIHSIHYRSSDRVSVAFEQGSLAIHPVAHIVAGRIKVPIGWTRNGLEVPFELLIDELSARSGVEVERA